MQRIVLDKYICCPLDHTFPLSAEDAVWELDELVSGVLRCGTCGNGYPVIGGLPNLLPPGDAQDAEVAAAKLLESTARDADAVVYDNTVPSFQTMLELDAILSALQVRPGDVVVDLGAGTGRLTVELARKGATVIAVDISPRSLEVNRAKCKQIAGANVHYLAVDACYLPLRDGIADKAGSGMMLEHIPTDAERRRSMQEIHRVLKPGGQMAITVYNYSLSKRRRGQREGHHGRDLYYYRFDGAEMRRILDQFRVRTVTALLNVPGRLRLESKWLERAIGAIPPLAQLTGDLLFVVAERTAPLGGTKATN
jgi:ubiquinone/menaquinone biosynthesis C-methylase UbiE/uncharacterized protein YbaR (Trm112 family)